MTLNIKIKKLFILQREFITLNKLWELLGSHKTIAQNKFSKYIKMFIE